MAWCPTSMGSLAAEELQRLRAFAAKRLASPHGQQLCHYLDQAPWERKLAATPLVPWEMSLGFKTPHWAGLSEAQQLALNHWTYVMMYFRIADGERFVVLSNEAVAEWLAEREPELANLLRLEVHEEVDHIAAFRRVLEALSRHHGLASLRLPVKPLRPLIVSRPAVDFLVNAFGADFVTTYYLGRGLVNHMGKAFETRVAQLDGGDEALTRLSMLHTVDENRHMAVSRMMAACAYSLVGERQQRSPLYEALNEAMQGTTLRYTFSDRITTGQERAMSQRAVPQLHALRSLGAARVRELVDAHFDGVTGIEDAKNEYMPRFNQRLLDRAALSPAEKRTWFELLVSLQRNLQYFPAGYVPGQGPAEDFDDDARELG